MIVQEAEEDTVEEEGRVRTRQMDGARRRERARVSPVEEEWKARWSAWRAVVKEEGMWRAEERRKGMNGNRGRDTRDRRMIPKER